jgi:tetratricopeptide (TPR) repeat protein
MTADGTAGSKMLASPHRVAARKLANKRKAAREAFSRGVRAWGKHQSDEALRHLCEAVRLDPDFLQARTELGNNYTKTEQPEQALEQYELALKLDPNSAALHSNKAAALAMLNRWEEAEQSARYAVQLDPESVSARFMLEIAVSEQGER